MANGQPPSDFGNPNNAKDAGANGGIIGPGNKLGCPPGFTEDIFGRCIPNPVQPPNNPAPGNNPASLPTFSPPYNCGKGADGSAYPDVGYEVTKAYIACTGYGGTYNGKPVNWLEPRTQANLPPDPGYPSTCQLTWYAYGTNVKGYVVGTYQDFIGNWLDYFNVCVIATPKPAGTSADCSCDLPMPDPAPCSYCNQSSGSNPSCPVCTINVSTQPIADALDRLFKLIQDTPIECDQISSKCLDRIAQQVKDILDSEGMTCSQCCENIANGVALSASEALVCASCDCTNLENQCSPGLGHEDGSTCQGCGQEPCCCNAGVCEPCEEQPQQKQYIGWFNCETGETATGVAGGVAFGPPWTSTGTYSDEAAALTSAINAVQYCARPTQPTLPAPPPGNAYPIPPGCDISVFSSPQAAGSFMVGMAGSQALLNFEAIALQASKGVFQVIGDELGSTFGAYQVGEALLGPITGSALMSPLVATMIGCGNQGTIQGLTALSALGVAGNLAGIDYTQFTPQIGYAIHASCRNRQLSTDSAMSAYLSNQIDYGTLDTHWSINGYCPQSVGWAAESSRSKPVPTELIQLNNRGIINDQQFSDGMRRLGYTDGGDVNALKQLGQVLPPYSDIVRMMVRDVGDDSLVQRFGLDTDFGVKYSAQLKQWAAGQGVSDKIMQYLWRSHWSIPAPGQLFEMYHRLRKTGQFGNEAQVLSDVTTALEQQDILPFWIPRLLAISFRPLTRVDARRAFQVGAIDESGVYNSYIDQGYSDDNAQILTNFTKRLKSIGIRNEPAIKLWLQGFRSVDDTKATLKGLGYSDSDISNGLSVATAGFYSQQDAKALIAGEITLQQFITNLVARGARQDDASRVAATLGDRIGYNTAIDAYEAGTITRDAAITQMVAAGISAARANYFCDRIDGRLSIAATRNCQSAVRRQFLTGGLSNQEAVKALQSAGVVAERAGVVVSRWQCELSARTRQPSLSMLCKWLAEGSISPDQFLDRARRLGFSADDAVATLGDCNVRINTARMRQAIANAKADAAAAAKAQRQAEREASIALAQANNLVKARKLRAQAISRRQKTQYAIVDKIILLSGVGVGDASATFESLLTAVKQAAPVSIDDALEIVTRAVDSWDGVSVATLTETATGLAALYNATVDDTSQPDDAYPFITTG